MPVVRRVDGRAVHRDGHVLAAVQLQERLRVRSTVNRTVDPAAERLLVGEVELERRRTRRRAGRPGPGPRRGSRDGHAGPNATRWPRGLSRFARSSAPPSLDCCGCLGEGARTSGLRDRQGGRSGLHPGGRASAIASRPARPRSTQRSTTSMATEKISAETRTEFGKGAARRIRRDHKIPAVVYGHGNEPVHVALPGHDTMMALKHGGANALLELDIDGTTQLALTKAVQIDPIRRVIEHIDFVAVRFGEKVTVDVPVHLSGDAASGDPRRHREHHRPDRGRGDQHPRAHRDLDRGAARRHPDPGRSARAARGLHAAGRPGDAHRQRDRAAERGGPRGRARGGRGRGRHRARGARAPPTRSRLPRVASPPRVARPLPRATPRRSDGDGRAGLRGRALDRRRGSAIPVRRTPATGTTSATSSPTSWSAGSARRSRPTRPAAPRSPRAGWQRCPGSRGRASW